MARATTANLSQESQRRTFRRAGQITRLLPRHSGPINDKISMMESDDLARVQRIFDKAQQFARSYRFEMTDEYRALIARVEALPQNQAGADRSGRWLGRTAERQTARAMPATWRP